MKKPKSRKVRKILFVEHIDQLLLLTEAQLKVFLYHYRREGGGNNRMSFANQDTVRQATGLSRSAVTHARTWLKRNGWLTVIGLRPNTHGGQRVREYRCCFPTPIEQAPESLAVGTGKPIDTERIGTAKPIEQAPESLLNRHLKAAEVKGPMEVPATPNSDEVFRPTNSAGNEGRKGREEKVAVATLPPINASQHPTYCDQDTTVPSYFSQRLGRNLRHEEIFLAEGLYQDFMPNSNELPPEEIIVLAEVAIDMQILYQPAITKWEEGGCGGWSGQGYAEGAIAPIRGFWQWNKTHRTGTKYEFLSMAQMNNAWFAGKRMAKAKWEAHDPNHCPLCQKDAMLFSKMCEGYA